MDLYNLISFARFLPFCVRVFWTMREETVIVMC